MKGAISWTLLHKFGKIQDHKRFLILHQAIGVVAHFHVYIFTKFIRYKTNAHTVLESIWR